LLAEAYAAKGLADRGLALFDEALAIVDKTGERFYEAELYRQKGELLVRSHSDQPDSHDLTARSSRLSEEECFLKAIGVAQRQQAKSFELRSAMELARLWQRQGRIMEARTTLAQIFGWFTEGFDTADLKDAKALLDELNR
jgi:predicted ATPase